MTSKNLHKSQRVCGECSRTTTKFARVYRAVGYCRNCYSRLFKPGKCTGCGKEARLPWHLPEAICHDCERSGPCVRCGKVVKRLGKRTANGPACPSCARYFRAPEPCEVCGTPSQHLSRVARLGHNKRICPQCASADHGTCSACGRNRLLTNASDGRQLCARCADQGEIPCPECGRPMPAGRGKRCVDCYYEQLADKRITIDCNAFSTQEFAIHFADFGKWLSRTRGTRKASLTIHGYLAFFLEIEREWSEIPGYDRLLVHFSAKGLRQALLPVLWMTETNLVVPDGESKEADSDRRRIESTLGRVPPGTPASAMLARYHHSLTRRVKAGRIKHRSVRLALASASGLLVTAIELGRDSPDQRTLDVYLKKAPGQRDGVSGFLTHLRDEHGFALSLPKRNKLSAQRKRRQKLKNELALLMRDDADGTSVDTEWIRAALCYFHDLPRKEANSVMYGNAIPDQGGLCITVNRRRYWIPLRMVSSEN